MNRVFPIIPIFLALLFLCSCQNNDKTMDKDDDINMNEYDIFDFAFIDDAPEATEKHILEDVIKVLFEKNDSSLSDTIAVDIENNEIYVDPHWSTLGVDTFEDPVILGDAERLLNILKKYDVQSWKEDYTTEDPSSYEDGYGWNLWLQFKDGTVEKHGGSGSFAEEITPENFDAFFNELNDFVEEKLEETEEKGVN